MTTGRWLIVSLLRHLATAAVGWTAAASVLPVLGDGPSARQLGEGMLVGLLAVPLLTLATFLVLVLLCERRFEPPTGGAARIRGGWLVLLPLVPLLPLGLMAPLQYLIVLCAQVVFVMAVLPRADSLATAEAVRSVGDPDVPLEERIRVVHELARFSTRPVTVALVDAATGEEPRLAGAALDALCRVWRRDGVVGEDLLARLRPVERQRVRGLPVKVRSPW
ncbi:hypothetical protein ABZZ17_07395 [Streptomyces sp. NPDC006512]|uniref:hypothetical protein n=1 Tax=Streptomyces sp. NPDC006512 TaxID=3154307 RepID=UPI0033B1F0CF